MKVRLLSLIALVVSALLFLTVYVGPGRAVFIEGEEGLPLVLTVLGMLASPVLLFAAALLAVASATVQTRPGGYYSINGGAPLTGIIRGENICAAYWKSVGVTAFLALILGLLIIPFLVGELWFVPTLIIGVAVIIGSIEGYDYIKRTPSGQRVKSIKDRLCPVVHTRHKEEA